ncbi:organic cation transporter protein isoform X1 [Drosophila grimshawi]|uniref:GH18769 n=1 Tax=Drosophila grimshawi TaxID=7222 RepID=B4JG22_DROGR|nr:organic cation transporter protein isoform X1 [Drosophila grimshawi]EDV92561.1 GH18769 [Drosophila grimshawi]
MSGVLRRGSLNFDCVGSARGSLDSNLYGGYRETKPAPGTPELSVITMDFRRHSDDLKKVGLTAVPPPMPQPVKDLSQDADSDVLSSFLGHYRKWSFMWTFLLCLFQIPTTFHLFMFVFQTAPKEYWCARPTNLQELDIAEWRNLSQSSNGCQLLDIDYSQLILENGNVMNWPSNASDMGYTQCTQFEFSDIDGEAKSLVQEFGLICANNITNVVEMCFLMGAAAGAVLSGWISDRFGRRHTLMAFVSIQTVFGGILAFSTSVAMFMSLRVIIGFASMTVTVVSFVLVVELVSGKWRTIIGILNILPVAISYVLSSGIAYLIRDWRVLQLVISWPWLAMLSIWYWLPESPRWLLAQGRLEELSHLIERAAKVNGTTLPSNYQKTLEAAVPMAAQHKEQSQTDGVTAATDDAKSQMDSHDLDLHVNPLFVVFSSKYWRTTVLTLVIWLTLIIIYFGLTLHLSNLGGNIYVNSAVAGSIEAISILVSIFVVLKAGIRRSLLGYMLLPGLCCLATNLVPQGDNNQTGVIALAIIAKCLIGANNAIIPTYTAMQYPTIVRNFGVGMGNLASGIALILVPSLWQLEHYDALLPLNIMGACGLIGAAAIAMMRDIE